MRSWAASQPSHSCRVTQTSRSPSAVHTRGLGISRRALDAGRLIKTYAFRGSSHIMTAKDAGVYLAIRSANRQWEIPSWRVHYGLDASEWPRFRDVVRGALADGPLSRAELSAAVARSSFRQMSEAVADPSHTILKPLGWQGDLSFGPSRDGKVTFQSLETNPHWAGIPDLDEAGRRAILAYLAAYGPARPDALHYWLVDGLSAGKQRLKRWMEELNERIETLEIDGEPALVLPEHRDELESTPATDALRLLPGYDQWVLGPGTADPTIVAPQHRAAITRGANLALVGDRVAGTWKIAKDVLTVDWFGAVPRLPGASLRTQAARIASISGRNLHAEPA